LYWTDYGTRDALGNHQHDGVVRSYDFANGAVATVTSGLAGPTGIGVTDGYVYVELDGGPLTLGASEPKIWRVPLAGGTLELVQDQQALGQAGAQFSRSFVSSGSSAF